jgi:hypothetical protein
LAEYDRCEVGGGGGGGNREITEGNKILRVDGTCVIVTNVATHREDLYQKYFLFSFYFYTG